MDERTLVEWKVCHAVLENGSQGAKDAQLGAMAVVLALALDASWLVADSIKEGGTSLGGQDTAPPHSPRPSEAS